MKLPDGRDGCTMCAQQLSQPDPWVVKLNQPQTPVVTEAYWTKGPGDQ